MSVGFIIAGDDWPCKPEDVTELLTLQGSGTGDRGNRGATPLIPDPRSLFPANG